MGPIKQEPRLGRVTFEPPKKHAFIFLDHAALLPDTTKSPHNLHRFATLNEYVSLYCHTLSLTAFPAIDSQSPATCRPRLFPAHRTDLGRPVTLDLVLLEAMVCGVSVATYPATDPQSVVAHGQTGWLSEVLGEAVHQALRLSPQAIRIHVETYFWERCTEPFWAHCIC